MGINVIKKKVVFSFMILLFSISLFVFVSYAYFTDYLIESASSEMGFVDADLNLYFDDGSGNILSAQEAVIDSSNEMTENDVSFNSSNNTISSVNMDLSIFQDGDKIRIDGSTSNDGRYIVSGTPTSNSLVVDGPLTDESAGQTVTIDVIITKTGVYYINVVSNNDDYFFEDFRVYLNVNSNVDTYLRIKIYEQLTLTYTDYFGQTTELIVLYDGYMPFNYDTTNWYDNRIYDNYIYCKTPVQRVNETTPYEVGLITSYFSGESFNTYSPGYSLQIGFSVEAVQSDGGPENVWGLTSAPWGGSW